MGKIKTIVISAEKRHSNGITIQQRKMDDFFLRKASAGY